MGYDSMTQTFANAPGVTTSISGFGDPSCAPVPYESFYAVAEAVGYTSGMQLLPAVDVSAA